MKKHPLHKGIVLFLSSRLKQILVQISERFASTSFLTSIVNPSIGISPDPCISGISFMDSKSSISNSSQENFRES